ncbi:MAG: transglutaminase [Mucilaginibacter sp.]|nr:transglutaminase [Mucilaginibacter sp.]
MKKALFIHLFLLLFITVARSQDFPVNAWTQKEMEMTSYKNDTTAHALVLNEHGDSKLDVVIDGDEHIRLIYHYHIKIKIFDELGIKHGTVEIPLYNNEQSAEEVSDITGFTVYKDNTGGYKTESLNQQKIYRTRENKNYTTVKFALPGVSKGCIIEYSYTETTPYFENFHDWQFQNEIPKLHSDYDAHIPGFWTYNISIRGGLKLKKNTAELEHDCFTSHGAKCDCSHLAFRMDSIPAFIPESYMTAPKNFMSALYFELSEYINPYNGTHTKVAKQWSDVDYQLKHDDNFGGQVKRRDLLKDRIPPAIVSMTDELKKAEAVYAYIQKGIKWDGHYSFYSTEGIRKALDKHTGNVGEVNLSLVAALNAMGLNAEAVLLSTRENGIINKLYPVITEFNYVIAKVNIGDKSYLLDATDPLLSFGMLPLRCLNDQGRVMSLNKPSYWVDMTTPQNETRTYIVNLALQNDGKLKGTFSIFSRGYAAYQVRKAIKEFNSVDEYVENLDEKLTKIKILKSNITNVDTLNAPISEIYDIEIDEYKGLHNKLSFNPYIFDRIQTNPFKLAERVFPVDWGMPSETRFVLTVQLPDGYTIENPPENISIGLPNQGGSFIAGYQPGTNSFVFSHNISFKKSIYKSDEYPYLKEFYNKIILSEKAEMIFVKN